MTIPQCNIKAESRRSGAISMSSQDIVAKKFMEIERFSTASEGCHSNHVSLNSTYQHAR